MTSDDLDILRVQRELRTRLFEGPTAIRWKPGRELAAQLLLYLDDPTDCWRITAEWLRETLDADRVDAGFGGFVGPAGEPSDYLVLAEARRNALPLPSVLGLRFGAANPGLRSVWTQPAAAAITDVAQERNFPAELRGALQAVGTMAKLAIPVRDGGRPVGLICADWHRRAPRWDARVCNELGALANGIVGQVMTTSRRIRAWQQPIDLMGASMSAPGHRPAAGRDDLTPAEQRVAELITRGLSYKEVARQLGRSLSTVDHHLRSIRDKLGVRSTARLVHLMHEAPPKWML